MDTTFEFPELFFSHAVLHVLSPLSAHLDGEAQIYEQQAENRGIYVTIHRSRF